MESFENVLFIFVSILAMSKASALPEIGDIQSLIDQIDVSDFRNPANLALENLTRIYNPDVHLSTIELIHKYGYNGEIYPVATYDNYILELHRITGTKENSSSAGKPAVLIMHGVLSSSADWVISGPGKALAYILADAGYDVWMGNARGTTHSRKHNVMSIDDKDYWFFSWHEIGIHDLPTMIDFVLDKTGQKKLFYIGHSQGTTAFFVMSSELPEYNNKINAMFALAPVAYVSRMKSPFMQILARFINQIDWLMNKLGLHEFLPTNDILTNIGIRLCDDDAPTQAICTNALFIICGFDSDQMNKTLLPVILGHVPAGSSVRQFVHYAQGIKSGQFRQYDYGFFGNWRRYRRITPPAYDLSKITAPVALHYSYNDWLSHPNDVDQLYRELGNPIGKFRVPHDKFNHLDYLWAINGKSYVYEKIISLMKRYRD